MFKKIRPKYHKISVAFTSLATLFFILSAYLYFHKREIPECSGILNVYNDDYIGKLFIHVSPVSSDEVSFAINGKIHSKAKILDISQIYLFRYNKATSIFRFNLIKTMNSRDAIPGDFQPLFLASPGNVFLIKIEQIDKQQMLFINNFSPLFICSRLNS